MLKNIVTIQHTLGYQKESNYLQKVLDRFFLENIVFVLFRGSPTNVAISKSIKCIKYAKSVITLGE